MRPLYTINPVGPVIEALHAAMAGMSINWLSWSLALALSLAAFFLGHIFFRRSRDEFADAL